MDLIPDDPALLEWLARQPKDTIDDPIWRLAAYRHAAFLAASARDDAEQLAKVGLRAEIAAQLIRSATSIAANVAEGYGRPTTADRIRFMSYALGSTREAANWYDAAGKGLAPEILRDRLARLARVRRILLGLIKRLRGRTPKVLDRW